MKIESYHEGDRSEQLAYAILSTIAHIVPVPRQSDHFGVDVFAHLFSRSPRGLEATGTMVALQLKSNRETINVDKPDALRVLHALAVPFLIAVVSRSSRSVTLYSTLFRFAAYWDNPDAYLDFDLEADAPGLTFQEDVTRVHCGPPIAIASQDDLDHSDREHRDNARQALRRILEYWIGLESDAIAWKATGLPMSPCPPARYQTNKYPGKVPSILLSLDMARLAPLLDAMQYAAIAFASLSDAAVQREGIDQTHAEVVAAMSEYAIEHSRRVSEFRVLLDDRLSPRSPYIID